VFAPRVGGRASAVLAAGATLAHVISPQGKKLVKLELPDVPTVPLRAVDLNGDGLTDLLVQVRQSCPACGVGVVVSASG
jgi:hypothetical protein